MNARVQVGGALVVCALLAGGAAFAAPPAPEPSRTPSPATAPSSAPDWQGTWKGRLENFPGRPGQPSITVTREVGGFPVRDGECTAWRTVYAQDGRPAGEKDYKLCRGEGPDDLYVDEGTVPEGKDVKLAARLLGDSLVSAFEVKGLLLVTVTRVRGDLMEEDIYVASDQPTADAEVPSLPVRSLQRLTLQREPTVAQ